MSAAGPGPGVPSPPPGRRPPRAFLTARLSHVVLASYRVPPALLAPHVPEGSELDTPDAEPDAHLLSVVALRFGRARARGIPIPTAQDFAEVNLRFYVRRGPRRAAVFLREFVPSRLAILGARLFFQQPYHRAAISHDVVAEDAVIRAHTRFAHRGHAGEVRLRARNEPELPPPGSTAHFLKERYWGFGRGRRGAAYRYRIEHPPWPTYPVEEAEVTIDPGAILGGEWRDIDWDAARHSVLFAQGSQATIYRSEPLLAP